MVVLVTVSMTTELQTAAATLRQTSPQPGGGPPALDRILIEMEQRSWEAWKNRDSKFFEDFLSPDHVEVGFSGTADKTAVVKTVASPSCIVNSYSVANFRVTVFSPTTAVVTYRAEQDTVCSKTRVPSPVWVSSLYVRRNGRWFNALYQQTQAAGAR